MTKTLTAPKQTYNDRREDLERPQKQRTASLVGRNGENRVPRRHHLKAKDIARLEEQYKDELYINPHGLRCNLYFAQVQALINLGPDVFHPYKVVRDEIENILSKVDDPNEKDINGNVLSKWAVWERKTTAKSTSQGVQGKILLNYGTLQRVKMTDNNPYGIKLAQFGMMISIKHELGKLGVEIPYFKLRTDLKTEDKVIAWVAKNGVDRIGKTRKKRIKVEVVEEHVEETVQSPEPVDDFTIEELEAESATELAADIKNEAIAEEFAAEEIVESSPEPVEAVVTNSDEEEDSEDSEVIADATETVQELVSDVQGSDDEWSEAEFDDDGQVVEDEDRELVASSGNELYDADGTLSDDIQIRGDDDDDFPV